MRKLELLTVEYGLKTLTNNEMDQIVIIPLDKSAGDNELAEIN